MTPPRTRRMVGRLAVLVAVAWPFVLTSPRAHQLGIQALAALLVAVSLVVTVGWLRTVTFFQPAALGLGGWTTAWLLGRGQALPVALIVALLAGAGVALASLALAGGQPRRGLPGASLIMAALLGIAVLPRAVAQVFPRPVILGVDLAGERTLYLVALGLVGLVVAIVVLLRRADVGRRLVAVGAGEELALRCGIDLRTAWAEGVGLAGALAGAAGCLLALQARTVPDAGSYSLAAAVVILAYPLLGGSSSLAGAGAVAVALTVLPALGGSILLQHTVLAGAGLALAAAVRPDGLAGIALAVRRDLSRRSIGWETLRWRVSR